MRHDFDTPPEGDFARYAENLVAQGALRYRQGQQAVRDDDSDFGEEDFGRSPAPPAAPAPAPAPAVPWPSSQMSPRASTSPDTGEALRRQSAALGLAAARAVPMVRNLLIGLFFVLVLLNVVEGVPGLFSSAVVVGLAWIGYSMLRAASRLAPGGFTARTRGAGTGQQARAAEVYKRMQALRDAQRARGQRDEA